MAIKSNEKKILIDSEDNSTCKLLEVLFKEQGLTSFRAKAKAVDTDNVIPDLIVYDIASHSKCNDFSCAPIKENCLYDNVPRAIISTYPIDYKNCEEFKEDRCIHFQKPFKIKDVSIKVKELLNVSEDVMATAEKRQYIRRNIKENCVLRLTCEDAEIDETKFVEALNHSKGGLCIIYNGEELFVGHKLFAYVENLNVIKKLAEVVWSKKLNGNCIAGLKWAGLNKPM